MITRTRRRRKFAVLMTMAATLLTALLTGVPAYGSSATSNSRAPHGTLASYSFTVNPGALSNLAEFVGVAMGFFQKFGIQPNPINSASTNLTLQLLETGQVDFASTNIITTITAEAASHEAMRTVAAIARVSPSSLVCRPNDGIPSGYKKGMPALVGKTVILPTVSGASTYVLVEAFRQFHIAWGSVKIEYVAGNPADVAALESNNADCAFLSDPGPQLLPAGYVTVINETRANQTPAVSNDSPVLLTVLQSFADAHPNAIKAMQKAIAYTDNYIGNPKNANKIAAAVSQYYLGFTQPQFAAIIRSIAGVFKNAATITPQQFKGAINEYNYVAPILGLVPASLGNAKFNDYVIKQLPSS